MKYILVLGTIGNDKQPWGGIIDIDKIPTTTEENNLLNAIKEGLIATSPWNYGEINVMNCPENDMFENMPFTGAIESTLTFYVCA